MPGTALFIQHHVFAPPAMLGEAFAELGYDIDTLVIPDTDAEYVAFPDPLDYDVLIPLGATMSVYDPALISAWVADEMNMLLRADSEGIPVLGVCFGGQLLAQTHGGTVTRSNRPEIGWYEIDTDDPALVPEGPWYQWHSDRWTVPPGARETARNANASQAFMLRNNLAVQFHPELDGNLLDQWLRVIPEPEAGDTIIDGTALRQRTEVEQDGAAQRVRRLVRGFLNHVRN